MKPKLLEAFPSQIVIAREPSIVHFQMKDGAIVCAFDQRSGIGGGVLFKSKAHTASAILANFVKALSGLAKKKPEDLTFKIAGAGEDFDRIKELLLLQNLKLQGELKENTPHLEAFFYTDSGRLRVGASEDSEGIVSPVESKRAQTEKKRKVLIVDDSKTIRNLLSRIFMADERTEVIGAIENPLEVESFLVSNRPDVITLDIHMPEMDGVTLLKRIYPIHQIPTVIISSIRMEEGPEVLEALESGAVDYIEKPTLDELDRVAPQIIEKVIAASNSKVQHKNLRKTDTAWDEPTERIRREDFSRSNMYICIGASTGGTEAIRNILVSLPEKIPPILIVQHIPSVFSKAFASRLNNLCPFEVREAQDGDKLSANCVLIAPGGLQMEVASEGTRLKIAVREDLSSNLHKPSVDVLFKSAAQNFGKNAVGVLLTGMGRDGADGLREMKQRGAHTIAQDEATSVVYGMPKAAVELGAAIDVLGLEQIPDQICHVLKKRQSL